MLSSVPSAGSSAWLFSKSGHACDCLPSLMSARACLKRVSASFGLAAGVTVEAASVIAMSRFMVVLLSGIAVDVGGEVLQARRGADHRGPGLHHRDGPPHRARIVVIAAR